MVISGDDNFSINGVKPRSGLFYFRPMTLLPDRRLATSTKATFCLPPAQGKGSNITRLDAALRFGGVATNRLVMP